MRVIVAILVLMTSCAESEYATDAGSNVLEVQTTSESVAALTGTGTGSGGATTNTCGWTWDQIYICCEAQCCCGARSGGTPSCTCVPAPNNPPQTP